MSLCYAIEVTLTTSPSTSASVSLPRRCAIVPHQHRVVLAQRRRGCPHGLSFYFCFSESSPPLPLRRRATPTSGHLSTTPSRSPSPSPAPNVTDHPHPLPLHSRTRYE
ncbi:hypothetical protein AAZX31_08G142000 [Glycine max]